MQRISGVEPERLLTDRGVNETNDTIPNDSTVLDPLSGVQLQPNAPPVRTTPSHEYVTAISPLISISESGTEAGGHAGSLGPKAMDRLASIGLALIDFAFLVARFIGHRFDYIIRRGDSGWVFLDGRYLSDWSLVRHLGGDIIVGTGCRYDAARRILATPYIAVDIDHAGDATDLRDRYDRVLQALGRPSYVLRSSDSGGLHVYYLLTRAENLHVLRSFDGCRGDVMRLLRARGVREEKGRIEVYPRGQYKDRGPQPRLRAPFGAGSGVLDVETLEPVAGAGAQSLVWARDSFERGKVRVVDPTEWRSACRELPPEPAPIRERRKTVTKRPARRGQEPSGRAPTGHDAAKVQEYLTHGLTGRRQLNAAASALAFHFRFGERMEREEAIGAMLAWLESQHNGMSATYNAHERHIQRQSRACPSSGQRGCGACLSG
jgi:hypothetical protein